METKPIRRAPGVALITGAHGTIGRVLARHLATQGWQVAGTGHGQWHPDEARAWGVALWQTGELDLPGLRRLAIEPQLVVHCAGSGVVGASLTAPYVDFQRTVDSTAAVLEYLRADHPRATLVLPSSAAVYGVADTLPMAEDSPLRPASPYGVHKKIAEELVCEHAARYGLDAAIVRLFSVYGEGFRKQLLWDACRRIRANETLFFGSGAETRDWLHVTDAAALLETAAAHAAPRCPIVNGGCGAPVTVRAVVQELFRLLGRSDEPTFCGTQRPGDPLHYHADMRKAHAWGWRARVGWREGLARYVAWFQQQRDLA